MYTDYDIQIRRRDNPNMNNTVLINKTKEMRELEWARIEQTVNAAKRQYLDGERSMPHILGEMMELVNNTRTELIRAEEAWDPSADLIREDLEERRAFDQAQIREMIP